MPERRRAADDRAGIAGPALDPTRGALRRPHRGLPRGRRRAADAWLWRAAGTPRAHGPDRRRAGAAAPRPPAFQERLGGMSEATFITTAGNGSLDSCSQALAAHLDVPTLASDVYRGGAERFAGDSLGGTALSALAGDLRF